MVADEVTKPMARVHQQLLDQVAQIQRTLDVASGRDDGAADIPRRLNQLHEKFEGVERGLKTSLDQTQTHVRDVRGERERAKDRKIVYFYLLLLFSLSIMLRNRLAAAMDGLFTL